MVDESMKEIFVYEKEASRLELFVRFFYAIPVYIVLFFYSIAASVCLFLQFLVILILGRRSKPLNGPIEGYIKYSVCLMGYFSYLSDERPGIVPKKVKLFKLIEED